MTTRVFIDTFRVSADPTVYDTERDNVRIHSWVDVGPKTCALVMVDVWATHPDDGWAAREDANVKNFLAPALVAARKAGFVIIHAPSDPNISYGLHPLVQKRVGEYMLTNGGATNTAEISNIFAAKTVRHVFYAGYATNKCFYDKPQGLIPVWKKQQAAGQPQIFLIMSDCTIAVEAAETLDEELLRRAYTINMAMLPGIGMCSNAQFLAAFPSEC